MNNKKITAITSNGATGKDLLVELANDSEVTDFIIVVMTKSNDVNTHWNNHISYVDMVYGLKAMEVAVNAAVTDF